MHSIKNSLKLLIQVYGNMLLVNASNFYRLTRNLLEKKKNYMKLIGSHTRKTCYLWTHPQLMHWAETYFNTKTTNNRLHTWSELYRCTYLGTCYSWMRPVLLSRVVPLLFECPRPPLWERAGFLSCLPLVWVAAKKSNI